MHDDSSLPPVDRPASTRRSFLKVAGAVAATVATTSVVSCTPSSGDAPHATNAPQGATGVRNTGFDRATIAAVGEVVLPAAIGAAARRTAVTAFVAWIDGYEPVAEEMHGYGYADVRYLPPDPAPAWRAQLEGLDLLSTRMRHHPFAQLNEDDRREVLTAALAHVAGDRLPAPLGAPHVAIALLAHWAATADAWNLALGALVSPNACRTLDGVGGKPLPILAVRA